MDEKVDEVEALNMTIEKSAKGAIENLKEINEKLKEDITNDKKLLLLVEQNKQIRYLQQYFDKK